MAFSLRIGTAGWSYPHWNGVVYPQGRGSGFHPLDLIARHMDTVEINCSFYQDLKPEVTKLWLRRVSAHRDFLFTAKLHRRFSHERVLDDAEARACKEGLLPLLRARKLGALLMQFPWSFRFTEENREFLIRLRRAFGEFPLVAEMRHDSWLAEDALGTFLDYKIGFCNIDQPSYTRAMPPTATLTSGVGYVRLHGRNPRNSLGAFDPGAARVRQHDYLYTPEDLEAWADRIRHLGKFAERTFVIFNNDAGAKSFVNALQLRVALREVTGGLRTAAPLGLRQKYPVELEGFGPKRAVQQSLFQAA